MSRVSKCTNGAALVTLLLAPLAFAGELRPAHIPADAKWIIHVDYESFRESGISEKLRERNPFIATFARNWLIQQYGMDPAEDIRSATMFSRDYQKQTGTVILHTDYDAKKVEAKLKTAIKHATTQWQRHTLHTVTLSKQRQQDKDPSGDQEMTVVMLDNDTIILASSVSNAQATIKLIEGSGESLIGKSSPLLTKSVSEAWFYGAAIDLGKLRDHEVSMPVLSQHEQVTLSFGKRDGMMYKEGTMIGQSEAVAQKMQKVLEGMVASGQLWAYDSEPLKSLYRDVNLERNGNAVSFSWKGNPDQVLTAMNEVCDRFDSWKQLLMK